MPYVYLLKSLKDYKQYIGSTINLEKRLEKHNRGEVKSTKYRRPLKLIGYEYFKTIQEASLFETRYKRSHNWLERRIRSGKFRVLIDGE
ncbi:MAG: hypothetical protein A2857_03935 [Candidatus Levybacteria bacterium RIFCSPHIGHO2_01_FULL_36_15]|nr:MAG: hypothetical protein A2857_03935 [Candidatus Levybacteria bacterium RIFCSPHIGHO2_01_FULL_36_15]OGH38530.1 MAG: hypothetical protein A2905_02760 [Candidatus Levybacteria bacterium RIFCSPLOWO2_01_FULL_36_10]